MLQILSMVCAFGSLICFIIVLIKLFQTEGALKGILGFICSLYTFVWGWMNATKLNIKNIMMIWTVLLILTFVLSAMGGGFQYSVGTPTP